MSPVRGTGPATEPVEPALAAPPSPAARAGLLTAIATLALAAGSGLQAVLYLSRFGLSQRTDAFFAAFAAYTVFGVFCQAMRVTSVPLLVGDARMAALGELAFARALAVIAVPVLVACELVPTPLAAVLAPGAHGGARELCVEALRILGGAMVLQLAAAGIATVLGIRGRFGTMAQAYVAGAAIGVATYLACERAAGELALGWSMLAMAAVTAAWLLRSLVAGPRAKGGARPVRGSQNVTGAGVGEAMRGAAAILGRTAIYFVFNGLYLVSLAFATRASPGDATVLSYAYLFASYVVAGTGTAIGISRVPDLTRGAQDDWDDVVADTVPHGFRYAMLAAAPALGALIASGAQLIGSLLPHSLPDAQVSTLEGFAALLVPWTIGALLVNFALPALFALERAALINRLAVPAVALHVLITLGGYALGGVWGVVATFWVTPAVLAAILVGIGTGHRRWRVAREIGVDSVRACGLAAATFALGAIAGRVLGHSTAAAVLAGGVGAGLYLVGMRILAPRPLQVLLGARRAT